MAELTDNLFAIATPLNWIQVTIWAAMSGAASMLVYVRFSPQQRLKELKAEAAKIQEIASSYDGDFQGAMILARRSFENSLRRLGCALLPSLLSGLPVAVALAFVRGNYVLFFVSVAVASLITKTTYRIE